MAIDARARRVAELYLSLQNFTRRLEAARAAYDAELIAARREHVGYAMLGDEILIARGEARTAENLARVEWVLRSATRAALRRRVKGDPADHVDARRRPPQDEVMKPLYIRETIYDPAYLPPAIAPAARADDQDDDDGDAEDDERDDQLGGDDRDELDGDDDREER